MQAAIAHQLRAASDRLGLDVTETLRALLDLASSTPAGLAEPAGAPSTHDEAVLREAGSLAEPLPSLVERGSATTAVATLALLRDALTVKQAAARLRVTEGRVRQRIASRSLLGIPAAGGWRLPLFQFTESGEIRGLDRVLSALPENVHPLVVQWFLTTPHRDLGVAGATTPLAWLSSGGDVDAVVALATDLHAIP